MSGRLSRRDFLRYLSALAGAGLASGCVPGERPPTPTATHTPTPSPTPSATATPTPLPVPPPEPVSTTLDVMAIYHHGRGLAEGPDKSGGYGLATVVPLYGEEQTPPTMMMDIKWAREHGITTFVMPVALPDTSWERRLEEWFLPVNNPPFEIDYALQFNPAPYFWEPIMDDELYPMDPLETGVVTVAREFLSRHIEDPRYKRLPDGRPVVFYYWAQMVACFLGVDVLENTVDLLRSNLGEEVFLIGEVLNEVDAVKWGDQYQDPDFLARQVRLFDAISTYYLWRAGYTWNSLEDYNHVVSPFPEMVTGYEVACEFWAEKAHEYGSKLIAPIAPTGVSNRGLYEGGLLDWLVDRHEGVSYETAKAMAEVGAKYADPDLRMVLVGAWNECNEGAAIVPSKQFGFDPIHAVRDTFAIEPPGGWPRDYAPST